MRGAGREDNIWPDDVHSNKPHQQYADFLKSKMYRNDRILVACSDCPRHAWQHTEPRWVIHDANNPASPLCQRCHQVDVPVAHGDEAEAKDEGRADALHRLSHARTANTGGVAGDFGRMIKTPPYADAQEEENNAYWQGR
jgi:hypothetical protein